MSVSQPKPESEAARDRADSAADLLVERFGAEYAERWLLRCLGRVRKHKAGEVGE